MRRPRFSSILTLLTLAVTLGVAGVCAAAPQRGIEAELRAATACFAAALGVTPRWNVTVDVVTDSVEVPNTYGTTMTSGLQLEARIVYNVFAIQRDRYSARIAALHEVLHVATGELTGLAFAHDTRLAAVEAERLVRQVVRWPNWRGVCEQP